MMNSTMVMLHGLPGAGKDTLAKLLDETNDFTRVAFADKLYEEVADAFEVEVAQLQSRAWKDFPQMFLQLGYCKNPNYRQFMYRRAYDLYEDRTSRFHLQQYATEFRRANDPHYWVKATYPALIAAKGHNIAITDWRFEDEYAAARQWAVANGYRFAAIEVVREGTTPSQHVSDQRLAALIDHTVFNVEGDPAAMCKDVINYLIENALWTNKATNYPLVTTISRALRTSEQR
jgi:hypothetical protein